MNTSMTNPPSEDVPGQHKSAEIFVNTIPHAVTQKRISYEEVVRLAFPQGPFDVTYSVDYANEHGKDGTLSKGQDTKVHNGMHFNVIKSNRS